MTYCEKTSYVAKDADDADTGLDYAVVKVIKLTNRRENADRLSLPFSPAYAQKTHTTVSNREKTLNKVHLDFFNIRLIFAPYGVIYAWKFWEINHMQNDWNVFSRSVLSQRGTEELFCRKLIPKWLFFGKLFRNKLFHRKCCFHFHDSPTQSLSSVN